MCVCTPTDGSSFETNSTRLAAGIVQFKLCPKTQCNGTVWPVRTQLYDRNQEWMRRPSAVREMWLSPGVVLILVLEPSD